MNCVCVRSEWIRMEGDGGYIHIIRMGLCKSLPPSTTEVWHDEHYPMVSGCGIDLIPDRIIDLESKEEVSDDKAMHP